jgi:hypothetical protein
LLARAALRIDWHRNAVAEYRLEPGNSASFITAVSATDTDSPDHLTINDDRKPARLGMPLK